MINCRINLGKNGCRANKKMSSISKFKSKQLFNILFYIIIIINYKSVN